MIKVWSNGPYDSANYLLQRIHGGALIWMWGEEKKTKIVLKKDLECLTRQCFIRFTTLQSTFIFSLLKFVAKNFSSTLCFAHFPSYRFIVLKCECLTTFNFFFG